ncbi:MAG: AAA family ATPase [Thiomicrospira sp.]
MTQSTHTALTNWLSQPEHYPHPCQTITRIETHISTVFLTGDYAYKLKKPVNFGFLDFSDLAARKTYCEMEMMLNRRTAPNLYLDLITLYQNTSGDQFSFQPLAGLQIADYLIKMRQFDPDKVLSRYLHHHPLSREQTELLARAIADFHRQAEQVDAQAYWGSAPCVLEPMSDNFPTLLNLAEKLQRTDLSQRLKQLAHWTQHQHTLLAPLIEQRKQQGFVRACHGDLHLDNIALIDERPTLFDGIEFNEQFRWIDTLSDLAFLLIDLDAGHQHTLAADLLNRYLRLNGDYAGLLLLRFYQTYRALVRAKISGLRYQQLQTDAAQPYLDDLINYISLAESYAYPQHTPPTLYVMQGISGSGKSTLADQLHQQTGALIISSDLERKRLFGIAPTQRVNAQQRAKLYSGAMNQATYQTLYQACQSALQAGLSVIADATFLQAKHRQRFIELAHTLSCRHLTLSIQPDPHLAEAWITQRQQHNQDPSDADSRIMRSQIAYFEAPTEQEPHLKLKMGEPLMQISTFWNDAC